MSRLNLRQFSFKLALRLSLCALPAMLPIRAHAQQPVAPAPATQPSETQPSATQPSGTTHSTQASAEKKSEAEEMNVFRHSPTVAWIARATHLDIETTAKSLEYINFAVIMLAIIIPLAKIIPKTLKQREARLTADLEVAHAKTVDANARLRAVETKLGGLDAEIAALRLQVDEDIKADEARIKASIEEETARIVKAAEQEITVAGEQAQRGLKQFAADLAIDRAMSQLQLNPDTDRALIAEFTHDLDALAGIGSSPKRDQGGQS